MSLGSELQSQLKVGLCCDTSCLPLPLINSNWKASNAKLCVSKTCSVGGRVKAGFWNINNSSQWPQLWYLQTHEAQETAWGCSHSYGLQGLALLQMEHVYCRILPKAIRLISFYYTEKCTRPGAKMTGENRFDSNGQKKKHSKNRGALGDCAHAFWNGVGVPVALRGEAQPDWNLTRTYYFRNLFPRVWFYPLNSLCTAMEVFLLDVFWSVAICIVCEWHIEMGLGRSKERAHRQWDKEKEGKEEQNWERGWESQLRIRLEGPHAGGFPFLLDGWCFYKRNDLGVFGKLIMKPNYIDALPHHQEHGTAIWVFHITCNNLLFIVTMKSHLYIF